MAVYVLVHGSFHGGWCWRRVAPLLRAAGHTVHTPTLTGLGERVHLASPEVGLSTHIRDVVNVLAFEDLTGVVLVGHSAAWRELPAVYGAWISPYRYYHRWTATGLWPRILHALRVDEAEM
jgi:transposase